MMPGAGKPQPMTNNPHRIPLPPHIRSSRVRSRTIAWTCVCCWLISLAWGLGKLPGPQLRPAQDPVPSRPPLPTLPGQNYTEINGPSLPSMRVRTDSALTERQMEEIARALDRVGRSPAAEERFASAMRDPS